MTADLDTRVVELYAPMGEVLPFRRRGGDGAVAADRDVSRERSEQAADGFASSREQFESLVRFMDGTDAAGLDHAGLEERLDRDGRELLRRLLDDHLALRAVREQRLDSVVGDDEVTRGRVEHDHRRVLGTVFGKVTVSRMAYRALGRGNLHPADAALNLPVERHSHGLRRLAALEAARGSFQDAVDGIERACGQQLGKRQVDELAQIPAVDSRTSMSGARWGLAGAEAVLKLRAIKANGDFDAYWRYHLDQERHHVHVARYHGHFIAKAA